MPILTILPQDVRIEVPAGLTLHHAAAQGGVEMPAGCLRCNCGTCVVEVLSGQAGLEPPTDDELDVLDAWNRDPASYRLSCCTRIQSGEIIIRIPSE